MPIILQIILGSSLLLLCVGLHISISTKLIEILRVKAAIGHEKIAAQMFKFVSGIILFLLFSHTAQIYIWAIALRFFGALPGYEEAIYFSLVTYTTVGYGDVTLDVPFRILGAMASVTGIIAFGLTTAFLVGFFSSFLAESNQ